MEIIIKKIKVENLLLSKLQKCEKDKDIKNLEFLITSIHNSKELDKFFILLPIKVDNELLFKKILLFSNDMTSFEQNLQNIYNLDIKGITNFFAEVESDFSFKNGENQNFFIFLSLDTNNIFDNFDYQYRKNNEIHSPNLKSILESYY